MKKNVNQRERERESRPVEASWKLGRVRWMEGFPSLGLTSTRSAIGMLLLSSVSLQDAKHRTNINIKHEHKGPTY